MNGYGLGAAALAALAAAFSWDRSRKAGGFFERELYGMTALSHRRFALLSATFALALFASAFAPAALSYALCALYAVALILYFASFIRGASEEP